jgi:putative ABC transport system ATP-binding protein
VQPPGKISFLSQARALANRPRIILADEPTAALDSERAGIVMDLLRKLAVEQQAAIIAVTHDEKIIGRLDRIFRLRDGRLEHDGDLTKA